MIQAESENTCICPDCGYRCTACLGTNSMLSKEEIKQMKEGRLPFPFANGGN
jgi:hypothetical protein